MRTPLLQDEVDKIDQTADCGLQEVVEAAYYKRNLSIVCASMPVNCTYIVAKTARFNVVNYQ